MTTFSPLASVVLSMAMCSRFTLVPLSLLLLISCSRRLSPVLPAWPRNLAPEPARPGDSLPRKSARIPQVNLSFLPRAPPPRHNLRAKAVRSTPRAAPAVHNFRVLAESAAEAPSPLRAASSQPQSSAGRTLPSGQGHSRPPELQPRDKGASSRPRRAREQ